MKIYKAYGILFWLFTMCTIRLQAKVIKVNSLVELQKAINTSNPGDVIVLATGVYKSSANIKVAVSGTKEQPITIQAEQIGGTEITGTGSFVLASPASYVIIKGFKFTNSSSKIKSESGTSFCRWTRNDFETSGDGEDLTIAGNDQEIDHNNFENKNAMGRFLAIRGTGSQIAERLWIHHNYFAHFKYQGGKNGAEAFQFGLSGFSMSTSNSMVEHNLFEDCNGEAELISVKASGVTLRYNTFWDSKAQFTLRHGNHSLVYANYFYHTPGIRFFGDDHKIYSNYFENCRPAIQIGNGDGEVADGSKLTCHDRPDRDFVGFNTLVNNPVNIEFTDRKQGLGATAISIIGNLILGGGAAAKIAPGLVNANWKDNLIYKTAGAGDMPEAGYIQMDPRLKHKGTLPYHLSQNSPAINRIHKEYDFVDIDIDGQKRVSPLDIGADEYSDLPIINYPLMENEVGVMGK